MASSETVITILSIVGYASGFLFVYAAYWAFYIRHALAVRLYRNRALAVGLLSLFIIGFALPLPDYPFGKTALAKSLAVFANLGLVLVMLYFIDTTALTSRRSDPLLRDTFHWSKVRYPVWAWELFGAAFLFVGLTLSVVTGDAAFEEQVTSYAISASVPGIIYIMGGLVPMGSAVVVIPIALRSRDVTLHRHLKWLAGFLIAFLILAGALPPISILPSVLATQVTFLANISFSIVGAYCLYRSVRSLTTLNKIVKVGTEES